MKPFSRLLCPVDFSELSRCALDLAVVLARDFDASLEVLHVLDAPAALMGSPFPTPEIIEGSRRRAEEELARLKPSVQGVSVRFEIAEGRPHRLILDRTETEEVDLLVMGTHGLSGIERLLLGSTTEKVLHHVHRPLLAVSRSARHSGAPGASGGRTPFRTILGATDLSPECGVTLDHALSLARRYQADLIALHVLSIPRAPLVVEGAPWFTEAEIDRLVAEIRPNLLERLKARITGREPGLGQTTHLVMEGHPAQTILRIAEERRADLVVVGARGAGRTELGWIGSTCHRVMRNAPCPVLVTRQAA